MTYISLLSFLFGTKHSVCPFCLKIGTLNKKSSFCSSCHHPLPPKFFKIPLRLILIKGAMDIPHYESFLQRSILQGNLKDQGIDLFPLPTPYSKIYALCSLKNGQWKLLSHICFCETESLLPHVSAILYFLTSDPTQNSSLLLENLIMETSKIYSGIKRFFNPPLFILNLIPLEDILLNVPQFFSKIIETSVLSSSSFKDYVRSTMALWHGRRLLEILEDVFPSIFYTSFTLSSHTLSSSYLGLSSFLWILEKWNFLKKRKSGSFLSITFLQKWFSFKESSPKKSAAKISPILEFTPQQKDSIDAR